MITQQIVCDNCRATHESTEMIVQIRTGVFSLTLWQPEDMKRVNGFTDRVASGTYDFCNLQCAEEWISDKLSNRV